MPPDALDAWSDVIQPVGLSRLEPIYLPPSPATRHGRGPRGLLRFTLLVVLPTLLISLYFGLIAADRYVAESHFIIRKPNAPHPGPSQGLSIDDGPKGLGGDDSFAVRDFLLSRDGLRLLLDRADLRSVLDGAGNDWFWRFPSPMTGHTDEDLYRLYQSLVSIDYDSSTGVTTLRTQAFRPDEARRMATVLMTGAEMLLNRLSERPRTDAVHVEESEVTRSQQEALRAEDRVTAFRDREAVIDPTQISQTVVNTIAELSLELVEARAELEVMTQSSPYSPQIALFRARVAAVRQQIDHERATLAGNDRSLAPRIAEYERLMLQRGFAEKSFVSALNLLEAARLDALRQQTYLEQVVEPRAADQARYPWRIAWPLVTFVTGCLVFRMFRPRPAVRA
jgi:capsular polysaccharide transport system permease protein